MYAFNISCDASDAVVPKRGESDVSTALLVLWTPRTLEELGTSPAVARRSVAKRPRPVSMRQTRLCMHPGTAFALQKTGHDHRSVPAAPAPRPSGRFGTPIEMRPHHGHARQWRDHRSTPAAPAPHPGGRTRTPAEMRTVMRLPPCCCCWGVCVERTVYVHRATVCAP